MAGELKPTFSFNYQKGSVARSGNLQKQVDIAGTASIDNIQTIGTTYEALYIGDIGTLGYVQIENLDAVNYVEVGDGTTAFIKLKPGEIAMWRSALAAPQAKANTGACKVRVTAFED